MTPVYAKFHNSLFLSEFSKAEPLKRSSRVPFQFSGKVTIPVVMIEMNATATKKTTKIISILIWNQRSVDR